MAPLIPQSQAQAHLSVPDPSTMPTTTTAATSTSHSHPATPSEAAQAHTALLQQLDLNSTPRPFRNPSWKPPQRRNKTVKQILADQARRDALALAASANAANVAATSNNNNNNNNNDDGATTGTGDESAEGGKEKEKEKGGKAIDPSTKAATYKMSTLAIERRAAAAVAAARANSINDSNNGNSAESNPFPSEGTGHMKTGSGSGPVPTYTNIESAPSLHPASRRHYCDVTGLPAPYRDPKTRLRYHDGEVFAMVRTLGTQAAEAYLEARGAHTVLK